MSRSSSSAPDCWEAREQLVEELERRVAAGDAPDARALADRYEFALDVIGYDGLSMIDTGDGSGYREDYRSSLTPRYLNNRAQSIFGGSDEVQLNIIAKAILGL